MDRRGTARAKHCVSAVPIIDFVTRVITTSSEVRPEIAEEFRRLGNDSTTGEQFDQPDRSDHPRTRPRSAAITECGLRRRAERSETP
jgi:hypothetical protein